jgi:tyrosine-protein kinase Etk/Wzc
MMDDGGGDYDELELRDYLRILRRNWAWALLPLVAVTGLAIAWTVTRPAVYQASARVLLADTAAQAALDPASQNTGFLNRELSNEISLATSDPVELLVAQSLGIDVEALPSVAITADSMLTGGAPLEEAIQQLHGVPALDVVLAGPHTDYAATLIRSPETVDVIDKIAADHSIVLVDSPPVLPVTDSQALAATAVDHVLLVVRAGQSKRSEVTEALRRLEAAGRPATGLILTEAKSSASNSYKYSYSSNS